MEVLSSQLRPLVVSHNASLRPISIPGQCKWKGLFGDVRVLSECEPRISAMLLVVFLTRIGRGCAAVAADAPDGGSSWGSGESSKAH